MTFRYKVFVSAVAALSVAALAACSSGDDGDTGGDGATPTITVALGAVDPVFTQVYVAKYHDFFAKEKVNVEIKQVGTNALTSVVSGQADIGWSAAAAFVPPKSGKQTSIIYAGSVQGISGYMVTSSKTVANAGQCKKVGTLGPGTAVYRFAQLFQTAYKSNYEIVPLQDYPTILAAVVSGRVDCAVATYAIFSPKLADKTLTTIVDLRDTSGLPEGVPRKILDSMLWGLTDNLKNKSDAVVRFLKGLNAAIAYMKTATPAELAAILQKSDDFKAANATNLTATIEFDLPLFAPNNGQVPESEWPEQVGFWQSSDTYAQRVDMSYLQKANS